MMMIFASLASCKSGSVSKTKDIGLSPEDLSQDNSVIWQGDTKEVHYSSCPVGSASINRNCTGLKEIFIPLTEGEYSTFIIQGLIEKRAPGTAAPQSPALTAAVEKKKRLSDKIASGTLSPEVVSQFQEQIAQLDIVILDPKLTLFADELANFEKIMGALKSEPGRDIIFEEGEEKFAEWAAPFTGPKAIAVKNPCDKFGKLFGKSCWTLAAPGKSCNDECSAASLTFDSATIDVVGSSGSDENCKKVGALFGVKNFTSGSGAPYGCIVQDSKYLIRFYSPATTADAKDKWNQPICACK
jgi:hypothetical protein